MEVDVAIERNRACSVCWKDGKILLVKIKDPVSEQEFWVPPGGEISENESALECAIRETLEETGYPVRVIESVSSVLTYPFVWQNEEYRTTTTFFLAEPTSETPTGDLSQREPYIVDCQWMSIHEARQELAFHEDVKKGVDEILAQVELRFC